METETEAALANGRSPVSTNGHHDSHDTLEPKIIIGIDYGTTYSGVAAVYTANPDDLDIIKTWPGGNGITSDKVPTEISYEATGKSQNGSRDSTIEQIRWGFQFKPEEQRLQCLKLFLDRNQKIPHFVSPLETASQLRECGRTVVDAVADYLTKLYNHSIETLTRRYGESFMRSTKVEVVLTVPAVWSDAAKNATLQAAERAGIGSSNDLTMISEPEAAALYTLKTMPQSNMRVGDNFIVCDAGGGTVDLIAYKVTQLRPLRVEESVVGTGGLCGSAFLNLRFEDHVRARVGEEMYQHIRQKKPKSWMMGLRYFEEFVKRNVNDEEQSEVNVPFPGLPDDAAAGLEDGFLVMTAAQVKDIFEPVIREVIDLVEGQIDAVRESGGTVAGIILVGGFGQSSYLYTQLKSHFNVAAPPPYTTRPTHQTATSGRHEVEVLQPLHAWTAVVRGAVLRGVEGSLVDRRKVKCWYGTSYATVFDESQHPVSDRYWSPLWERWMVSDRMQWHIQKGTPISAEEPISFRYTRNFRPGQSLIVEDDIIACEADEAPDAYSRELTTVCTLKTDLSAVPRSLFTKLTTTNGVCFDNMDFELRLRIESASLVFELIVDGVRYGSVQAEFH